MFAEIYSTVKVVVAASSVKTCDVYVSQHAVAVHCMLLVAFVRICADLKVCLQVWC